MRFVAGPKRGTRKRHAKFRFRAKGDIARFSCKLDGHNWRRCRSPIKLVKLERGKHAFWVRAVTEDGVKSKRKKFRWHVRPKRG